MKSIEQPEASAERIAAQFTPKQARALNTMLSGFTTCKELAAELHTTEQVIKNLFHQMYEETGIDNMLALALWAMDRPGLREALCARARLEHNSNRRRFGRRY